MLASASPSPRVIVLSAGRRKGSRAFAVGRGLDLLGPFEALRAQLLGFALALRRHAVVDRWLVPGQVGAVEADLDDLDAERPRLGATSFDARRRVRLSDSSGGSVTWPSSRRSEELTICASRGAACSTVRSAL